MHTRALLPALGASPGLRWCQPGASASPGAAASPRGTVQGCWWALLPARCFLNMRSNPAAGRSCSQVGPSAFRPVPVAPTRYRHTRPAAASLLAAWLRAAEIARKGNLSLSGQHVGQHSLYARGIASLSNANRPKQVPQRRCSTRPAQPLETRCASQGTLHPPAMPRMLIQHSGRRRFTRLRHHSDTSWLAASLLRPSRNVGCRRVTVTV